MVNVPVLVEVLNFREELVELASLIDVKVASMVSPAPIAWAVSAVVKVVMLVLLHDNLLPFQLLVY